MKDYVKAVYFGDDIYIVMDESVKKKLPSGAIIYTLKEAQMLAGQSESVKKTAHEIKKMGGIVTESMVRLKYQKDGKNTLKKSQNLTDLSLPQVKHTEVNIEELLIRDIKEYSKLFPAHPKPMAEMILVWAEDIYGYKHNIKGRTKWARGLIKQALNG